MTVTVPEYQVLRKLDSLPKKTERKLPALALFRITSLSDGLVTDLFFLFNNDNNNNNQKKPPERNHSES